RVEAAAGAEPAPPAVGPAPAAASTRLALDGLELFPHLHEVVAEGREIAVTPTEFQLLETLMRSGRVVRSKEELARTLRGEEPDSGTFVSQADERTVEVHVGNLRRKLADAPRAPGWADTVRGVGCRMMGSPQRLGELSSPSAAGRRAAGGRSPPPGVAAPRSPPRRSRTTHRSPTCRPGTPPAARRPPPRAPPRRRAPRTSSGSAPRPSTPPGPRCAGRARAGRCAHPASRGSGGGTRTGCRHRPAARPGDAAPGCRERVAWSWHPSCDAHRRTTGREPQRSPQDSPPGRFRKNASR